MPRQPELYHWKRQLASRFPGLCHVKRPVVLGPDPGPTLGPSANTVRQRLKKLYLEKDAKAGHCLRELDVEGCFAPLLAEALSYWPCPRLALALDVTTLADRFHVLCASLVVTNTDTRQGWPGAGNFSRDPRFTNPDAGDSTPHL